MGREVKEYTDLFANISRFAVDAEKFVRPDVKDVIGNAGREFYAQHPGAEPIVAFIKEHVDTHEEAQGLVVSIAVAAAQPSQEQGALIASTAALADVMEKSHLSSSVLYAFQQTASQQGEKSLYSRFPALKDKLDALLAEPVAEISKAPAGPVRRPAPQDQSPSP